MVCVCGGACAGRVRLTDDGVVDDFDVVLAARREEVLDLHVRVLKVFQEGHQHVGPVRLPQHPLAIAMSPSCPRSSVSPPTVTINIMYI